MTFPAAALLSFLVSCALYCVGRSGREVSILKDRDSAETNQYS